MYSPPQTLFMLHVHNAANFFFEKEISDWYLKKDSKIWVVNTQYNIYLTYC